MKHVTHRGKIIEVADMVTPHLMNAAKKELAIGSKIKWVHMRPVCAIIPLTILLAGSIEEYCSNELKSFKTEIYNRNKGEEYESIVHKLDMELDNALLNCSELFFERVIDVVEEDLFLAKEAFVNSMSRKDMNEFIMDKINKNAKRLK